MMLFCLWLLVLVLALPVSGQAAVYYIAPSGNDGFPCTEAQPCKSINKGRSMLGPGDTLYFLGGVYNDAFNINTSNNLPSGPNAATPTVIAGKPGEVVTLTNSGGINIGFSSDPYHACGLLQHVLFKNFVIDGGTISTQGCGQPPNMSVGPHFIRFEDIEVKNNGSGGGVGNGYGATDLSYLRIHIHHNGIDRLDHGLYVAAPRTVYDGIHTHHNSGSGFQLFDIDPNCFPTCAIDVVIRNSFFHENATWTGAGSDGAGLTTSGAPNLQVYNNIFWNERFFGLDLKATVTNAQVYNNTIVNGGDIGLYLNNDMVGLNIRNNIIHSNPVNVRVNTYTGSTFNHNLCNSTNAVCDITGDPHLTNPPGWVFSLEANSAARNTGTPLTLFSTDYIGTHRPQGAGWDIGAYEFVEGGPPPQTCGPNETGTPPNCVPTCPSPHPSCPPVTCPPNCPPGAGVKAFPTAEGLGAVETTGGRGGVVMEVKNLNDSGAESLRACAEATGPRTCVFRVGGVIELQSPLGIYEANSYLTIAGQTAPGEGITLKYWPVQISYGAHDVIIRHLRHRQAYDIVPEDGNNACGAFVVYGADSPCPCPPGLGRSYHTYNVILDHISAAYTCDDSMQGVGYVSNVTFQWSLTGEGYEGSQGDPFGSSKGYIGQANQAESPQASVSYHHNMIVHSFARNPAVSPFGLFDYRYNLVYNWQACTGSVNFGDANDHVDTSLPDNVNFVGNIYLAGPNTQADFTGAGCWLGNLYRHSPLQIYVQDNETPWCGGSACAANAWNIGWGTDSPPFYDYPPNEAVLRKATPHAAPSVPALPRNQLESTLSTRVGATVPKRDSLDTRILGELAARTGNIGRLGAPFPTVATCNGISTTPPCTAAPADTDHDGMPDAWEDAHGLDKNNAADRNAKTTFPNGTGNGYTNVENYLNELAGDAIPTGTQEGPTGNPIYVAATGGTPTTDCVAAENQATPIRTIATAMLCMGTVPGKIMYIKTGTYTDCIDTSATPIKGGNGPSYTDATMIRTFGTDAVTIKPTSCPLTGVGVFFRNGANDSYIVLRGSATNKLVLDGTNVGNNIAFYPNANHIRFEYVDVVASATFEAIYAQQAANIEFVDSLIHGGATDGIVFIDSALNWLFERTMISSHGRHGIIQNSGTVTGLTVKESTVKSNLERGIAIGNSTGVTILNSLIHSNGGIGLHLASPASGPKVSNNTIAGNTGNGFQCDLGVSGAEVKNSIVFGNTPGNLVNTCTAAVVTNLTTDPLFVNAAGGDYHLADGSPGINAGTPDASITVDLDGNVRPDLGGTIDIGAYERGQVPPDPGENMAILQRILRYAGFFF